MLVALSGVCMSYYIIETGDTCSENITASMKVIRYMRTSRVVSFKQRALIRKDGKCGVYYRQMTLVHVSL